MKKKPVAAGTLARWIARQRSGFFRALKAPRGARGWVTVLPVVHIARRRIGNLLPLRLEPGRKFLIGTMVEVRKKRFNVRGFGYEFGCPVIHLEKV